MKAIEELDLKLMNAAAYLLALETLNYHYDRKHVDTAGIAQHIGNHRDVPLLENLIRRYIDRAIGTL